MLRPLDFLLLPWAVPEVSLLEGGVVGVMVTVMTLPVSVYTETTGVGVHVEEVDAVVEEGDLSAVVVVEEDVDCGTGQQIACRHSFVKRG